MKDSIAKEKKWGKNGWKLVPLRGGGRHLMANAILNFCIFFDIPLVVYQAGKDALRTVMFFLSDFQTFEITS